MRIGDAPAHVYDRLREVRLQNSGNRDLVHVFRRRANVRNDLVHDYETTVGSGGFPQPLQDNQCIFVGPVVDDKLEHVYVCILDRLVIEEVVF